MYHSKATFKEALKQVICFSKQILWKNVPEAAFKCPAANL